MDHTHTPCHYDVCGWMFIVDLCNMLIGLFSSFKPTEGGSGDVISSLGEARAPLFLLIYVIAHVSHSILDRMLYMCKHYRETARLVVLLLLNIGHGIGFGFMVNWHNGYVVQIVWFLLKVIYVILAIIQFFAEYACSRRLRLENDDNTTERRNIRQFEFRSRLGKILTCKGYTKMDKWAFQLFMLIPCAYELRALSDWMVTNTSLDIFNWLKMEDICTKMFLIKCQRVSEDKQSKKGIASRQNEHERERSKWSLKIDKFVCCFCFVLVFIVLIVTPLGLFVIGNFFGSPPGPYEVTMEIKFSEYEPIFRTTAEGNSILRFTNDDMEAIKSHYKTDNNKEAVGFLEEYSYKDVSVIQLSGKSKAVWIISKPSQDRLVKDLQGDKIVTLKLAWYAKRLDDSAASDVLLELKKIPLLPYTGDTDQSARIRQQLVDMLRDHSGSVLIPNFFPKFIRVPVKGEVGLAKELAEPSDRESAWRGVKLTLSQDSETKTMWWEVQEDCTDGLYRWLPHVSTCATLVTFSFGHRSFPMHLTAVSEMGLISFYVTVIYVIYKLLRSQFVDISYHIMFEELQLPFVDTVLTIFVAISIAREDNDLRLEKAHYDKLIFLYRSPEMMRSETELP